MQVIPVIDLLGGQAVRAVRGDRTRYRPVQSQLCTGSEPLTVARALLAAAASTTLYVADLGAILGQGAHVAVLRRLCEALPGHEIWLDAGFQGFDDMLELINSIRQGVPSNGAAGLAPVFGTETLRERHALARAQAAGFAPLLSLDFRHGVAMRPGTAAASSGPGDASPHAGAALPGAALPGARPGSAAPGGLPEAGVATDESEAPAGWWPARVIVMTLDRVGAYDGPDLGEFARARSLAGNRAVFGAGGVRAGADFDAAAAAGASGWLVASALHDRRLEPARAGAGGARPAP